MYIGIDIGGTNIKYGVIDNDGEIIEKSITPTKHNREYIVEKILAITNEYTQRFQIEGVGISVPGIVDEGYLLTGGAIKELYGFHLQEAIEQGTGLPTIVENDANAVAIAEKWVGHAINRKNYICMVLGTGVGGGIVINNELYRGSHGMAGEFGWMVTRDLKEGEEFENSSLNLRASVISGLYRQYQLALEKNGLPLENEIDAIEIMEKAKNGNEIAMKVMNDFYEDIAIGVINLIAAFDPEVILIGGGISANVEFMDNLLDIIDQFKNRHLSIKYLKNKGIALVEPTKLKNDAGIIGAAYLVRELLRNTVS